MSKTSQTLAFNFMLLFVCICAGAPLSHCCGVTGVQYESNEMEMSLGSCSVAEMLAHAASSQPHLILTLFSCRKLSLSSMPKGVKISDSPSNPS